MRVIWVLLAGLVAAVSVTVSPVSAEDGRPSDTVLTWTAAATGSVADIDYHPGEAGYWVTRSDGSVTGHGVDHFGDRPPLVAGEQVASLSPTPTGAGYWLFTDRGRVHAYGDAVHHGDLDTVTTPTGVPLSEALNGPIVGSTATPTGGGYWMVASDGGIFAFGDAEFFGSMGGTVLNQPVNGLAPTPTNNGYWLVASDGGIFAFGDAGFFGSVPGALAPGTSLNSPVTTMLPQGDGYLMVATDGGIFNFGNSQFLGTPLDEGGATGPVVAGAVLADRSGYLLIQSDGRTWSFGTSTILDPTSGLIEPRLMLRRTGIDNLAWDATPADVERALAQRLGAGERRGFVECDGPCPSREISWAGSLGPEVSALTVGFLNERFTDFWANSEFLSTGAGEQVELATPEGVRVGSSRAEVLAAYPNATLRCFDATTPAGFEPISPWIEFDTYTFFFDRAGDRVESINGWGLGGAPPSRPTLPICFFPD